MTHKKVRQSYKQGAFEIIPSYTKHLLQEKMQKCGKCKRIFATDEELSNHQSKCGLNNVFLQCHFCHKTFAKESSLKNHILAHMIPNSKFLPRPGK